MSRLDLADICNHLKAAVIPYTPEDFVIAHKFTLGLPNEELKAGIAAFRSFLYELYGALAGGKDRFDVKTGRQDGTTPARFPIVEELGAVLFQIGFHGRLETEPRSELVVYGADMLEVSKMQKYKHLNKMSKARKWSCLIFCPDWVFILRMLIFQIMLIFLKLAHFMFGMKTTIRCLLA
ncbi:MAG: hypothetical protein FWC93_06215 [Defluviitaleaceae bacterium]|nr:hypothetical protein [Defluviitaleaceae bacterium]